MSNLNRETLAQAAQLIKQGDKAQAREILKKVLRTDPRNADAWYLASFVSDTPQQRMKMLENALKNNPQHQRAQAALQRLQNELDNHAAPSASESSAAALPTRPLAPITPLKNQPPRRSNAPTPKPAKVTTPKAAPQQSAALQSGRKGTRNVVVVAIVIVTILGGVYLLMQRGNPLSSTLTALQYPGKEKIGYVSKGSFYLMNLDGTEKEKVLDTLPLPAYLGTSSADWERIASVTWSPDGTQVIYSAYSMTYMMDTAGDNEHWAANGNGCDFSPDGNRLVYTRWDQNASGTSIYVSNLDGSGETRLAGGHNTASPKWSPDGRMIAYIDKEYLYVMNADGSNSQQIGDQKMEAHTFAWSPDSTRIAARPKLFADSVLIFDVNQKKQAGSFHAVDWFDWSPDGKRFVYKGGKGIAISDLDGSNDTLILDTSQIRDTAMRVMWLTARQHSGIQKMRANRKIVEVKDERFLISPIYTNDPASILAIHATGDTVTAEVQEQAFSSIHWTTDAKQVVLATGSGIVRVNADGSNPVQLTDFGITPAFSPDGSKIAFVGGPSASPKFYNKPQLYLMDANGNGLAQLSAENAGEILFAWSPDSRQIAYLILTKADAQEGDLWITNVDGTGHHQLNKLVGRKFSWLADNKRLVFSKIEDQLIEGTNQFYLGLSLYLANADGSDLRKIAQGSTPDLSPDGKQIAFAGNVNHRNAPGNPTLGVFIADSDGSNIRQFSDSYYQITDIQWSLDGQRIVYVGRNSLLLMMNADGTGRRKLHLTDDEYYYTWVPSTVSELVWSVTPAPGAKTGATVSAPTGATATSTPRANPTATIISLAGPTPTNTLAPTSRSRKTSTPTPLPDTQVLNVPVSKLNFQVVAAKYSAALDRIIMATTGPNALQIYDGQAGQNTTVTLARVPTCLSVGIDGLFAAVGDEKQVTYVDLRASKIVKTFDLPISVSDIALAPNGWI